MTKKRDTEDTVLRTSGWTRSVCRLGRDRIGLSVRGRGGVEPASMPTLTRSVWHEASRRPEEGRPLRAGDVCASKPEVCAPAHAFSSGSQGGSVCVACSCRGAVAERARLVSLCRNGIRQSATHQLLVLASSTHLSFRFRLRIRTALACDHLSNHSRGEVLDQLPSCLTNRPRLRSTLLPGELDVRRRWQTAGKGTTKNIAVHQSSRRSRTSRAWGGRWRG